MTALPPDPYTEIAIKEEIL
jgi:hypothetical protein